MKKEETVPESSKMPELKKVETTRGPDGRWLPGVTPEGAKPFLPGKPGGPGYPAGVKRFTTLLHKFGDSEITEQQAIDELKREYGLENATRFVSWVVALEKIAMSLDGEPGVRRQALTDLLKFFVQMPNQAVDLGGQAGNPLEIEAKERAVVLALIGTIPAPGDSAEPGKQS
jgi:hypothetical protein